MKKSREELAADLTVLLEGHGELRFLSAVRDALSKAGTSDFASVVGDMCDVLREQGEKDDD